MLCPKCNKTIDEGSIECPFCGIVIEKFRTAGPFRDGTTEPDEEKTPQKIPYLKIGFVILGVILLWIIFRPNYAPEVAVISSENNESITLSCATKEKCVIVYLAPW